MENGSEMDKAIEVKDDRSEKLYEGKCRFKLMLKYFKKIFF